MKKMILLVVLAVTQISFATTRTGRPVEGELRTRIEKSTTYGELQKAIEELRTAGKDGKIEGRVLEKIQKIVGITVKGIDAIKSEQLSTLSKLMTVEPLDMMVLVAQLSAAAKNVAEGNYTPAEIKNSTLALEVLSSATRSVDTVISAKDAVKATQAKENVKNLLALTKKIAEGKLDLGPNADSFIAALKVALSTSSDVQTAVATASSNKFTLKELIDCE